MNRIKQILAITFCVAGLTGCNTFEGVGKDIKSAGGALADTAEKAKREMNQPQKQSY